MQALLIGTVWPEPNSTAAGSRMLQLIKLLQKANYTVTFASAAQTSPYSANLKSLKVNCTSITLNSDSFDTVLNNIKPNLVVYDRFMTEEQYGWRITENCPNTVTVLDTEDLHFLRTARQKAFKENRSTTENDFRSAIFQREMASILRCDLTLIISTFEYEILSTTYKINKSSLFYLPLMIENTTSPQVEFNQREHFISIGNFLHEPNWQTVLQLKKLWKNIRKQLPKAELHIYGSYVTEKAKTLHNPKEGFLVKGRADDKKTVFENAKVLLAPIPFGAGIKGKLLEAMQFGTPSVTTPIGFEGFGISENKAWNGYITDTEDDFIAKAILLYSNEKEWENAQGKGAKNLENFKISKFEKPFINRIEELQENLIAHRNKNYLSFILQQQSLQSSKFMSKWIMEKNKPNRE